MLQRTFFLEAELVSAVEPIRAEIVLLDSQCSKLTCIG